MANSGHHRSLAKARQHSSKPEAASSQVPPLDLTSSSGDMGSLLAKQSIENCGVVAVDLFRDADGTVVMANPRLLFGTKFASFSPTI